MRFWRVSFDDASRRHIYKVAGGRGHALMFPVATRVFSALRVSSGLTDGRYWWPIHVEPSVMAFESEHGADTERSRYNARVFAEVSRTRRTARGRHAGYANLFVPIVVEGQVAAMLATGPFATEKPNAATILERWQRLTGLQGHPADPEFASYLAATLALLVLDGPRAAKLERLLVCLAGLMSGEGRADALANEAEALYVQLLAVRSVERTWDAVRSMIDDRFQRSWSSAGHGGDLLDLGLERPPDHVLVGLAARRPRELDAVEEALIRDGYQRACAELARTVGPVLAGQVGGHGVVFLSAAGGSTARKKDRLADLAGRASKLSRRSFGLSMHFGACVAPVPMPLSRCFQSALGAAESSLVRGAPLVVADPRAGAPARPLADLQRDLARGIEERPELLRARFDRYLEAVALVCGYGLDAARARLETGFDRMTEALGLDAKDLASLRESLDRAAARARTTSNLFAAYRAAVSDVCAAVEQPVTSRRDRSLRRALEHVREHYAEPLRLGAVARLAGFAPGHFSKLFIASEGVPLAQYVMKLRLERARQLLTGTDLDVTRVARLSGFHSLEYFCRMFRRAFGTTPLGHRRR